MTAFVRTAALALAGVLLALVAAWLSPASAYACSCVTDSEPELVRNAEVIFTGTVTKDRAAGDTRTYTFAVDRAYRGQVLTTQTVTDSRPGPGLRARPGGTRPLPGAGLPPERRALGQLVRRHPDGSRPG